MSEAENDKIYDSTNKFNDLKFLKKYLPKKSEMCEEKI